MGAFPPRRHPDSRHWRLDRHPRRHHFEPRFQENHGRRRHRRHRCRLPDDGRLARFLPPNFGSIISFPPTRRRSRLPGCPLRPATPHPRPRRIHPGLHPHRIHIHMSYHHYTTSFYAKTTDKGNELFKR